MLAVGLDEFVHGAFIPIARSHRKPRGLTADQGAR
jgi:hypothetical protein